VTFLAPGYLAVAGGLAGVVVALHFIVTREPATVPLPTARFAPDRPVRARSRTLRFSDALLLACRTGLILAAGAALAQPIPLPERNPLARIVLADRSGSVADPAEVRDSVRALVSSGDALVAFDSAASVGSLSAALVSGLRAAVSMRDAADSLELAIVSAFGGDEIDQATDSIRALWPGGIRLVRVAARPDTLMQPAVFVVGGADDPLRYALPGAATASDAEVRVVRGVPGGADSAWAGARNHALVLWPALSPGAAVDTVGAVSAGDAVVVAPFARGRREADGAGRIVARWLDGAPAAVETAHGAGCIRRVDIPVPSVGDLVLDSRFQRLASRLTGRCGSSARSPGLDGPRLAALAGPGKPARVAATSIGRLRVVRSPLTPWLLAGALALGLGDLLLRRRRPLRMPEAPS
jgi:hypothetical protein